MASDNHQALKIMQRYGFISEGYFKEEILVDDDGQRVDLHRFALMQTAWEDHPFHQRLNRIAPIEFLP
ncbi:MAG: hypothetical protein B6247_21875 [Candidatus Parabeggiatoa sp. nov. 2]|nr:MAG: hypothetical protein B6247_21875 [Beggiatoa sp. 4572_84]